MSRLVAIIDAYKDNHGQPSDSSIARAIGVKPQTLSSWRTRGIKEPPDRDALRRLALLAQVDYENVVLRAALQDAGWIGDGEGVGSGTDAATEYGTWSDEAMLKEALLCIAVGKEVPSGNKYASMSRRLGIDPTKESLDRAKRTLAGKRAQTKPGPKETTA